MKTLLIALALVLSAAACTDPKLAALEAADGPGLMKVPLRGLPGEDKNLLKAIGASEDQAMKAVLALAARSRQAARLRCHALQSEAIDALVAAARGGKWEVDAEGNVDLSRMVPRLRAEGIIQDRSYTVRRAVDGAVVRFTALGHGEVAGDEWRIEISADPALWIDAGLTAPTVVKDACAGK